MSDAQTLAYDRLLLTVFYRERVNPPPVRLPFPVFVYPNAVDTTTVMISAGGRLVRLNWWGRE